MNGIFKLIKKQRHLNFTKFDKKYLSKHYKNEFKCFGNASLTPMVYPITQKQNFYKIKAYNFSDKNPNNNQGDKNDKNPNEEKISLKQEMTKHLLHMNLWILLSFGVTALYFLKQKNEKEVTFEDFAKFVQENKINEIEIKKGMDLFYYVNAQLKDNSKVIVKIMDNETFIRTLEKIQLEMVFTISNYNFRDFHSRILFP
jgi:hypothetical protein